MQRQKQYFVGLDIGTTAVRCIIGHINEQDIAPNIIGVGSVPNLGVRKGTIVNIQETIHAIDGAIEQAERMAGQQVSSATVNINGTHIVGMNSKGVIAVSAGNREITEDDVVRAEEAATVVQLPVNREIIQVFARNYRLDGQEHIKDPIGMAGVRLEVDAHVITASSPALRNLEKSLAGTDTNINYRLLSSLAAAEAVINRAQRENGVVVVDLGASTTNVAVFEEGDVQHVAVIPVGSLNITNDLAIGLRTELDVAERVKLQFASERDAKKKPKSIKVKFNKVEHEFTTKDVENIIEARLDEIFELVDAELKKIDRSGKLPGGAVLVGGGANMHDIVGFAKNRLKLPARVMKPSGFSGLVEKIDSPKFATAIGLMLYDMHVDDAISGSITQAARGNIASVGKYLGRLLDKLRP